MATDGYVQVPPDSSGKLIDTTQIIEPNISSTATSAFQTVQRERVDIGQGEVNLQDLQAVLNNILMEIRDMKFKILSALH